MSNILAIHGDLNLIMLLGLAVFGGAVGAKIFQRMHIPQIVGYVAIGIFLGPVFGIVKPEAIDSLEPFNMFALGLIGFLIGGELKREMFTKLGKQVGAILLFEGIAAFLLVGISSFIVMRFFFDWRMSLAVAVVLGAICAATDPASTVSVLWEYKTRGPLTTMLTAIVALDDALALVLYAIGVSVAGVITGNEGQSFIAALGMSLLHVGGALVLGGIAGYVLYWIVDRIDDREKVLVFSVGSVMVIIGLALMLELDVIIAAMTLGVVLTNCKSRRAEVSFKVMHQFSSPIYVLFFVLVGARLQVEHLNLMILLLTAAYVIGSIVGKTGGAYLGALYSHAPKTVRKYMGFCLYPQGGIAVGLLIMASSKFAPEIASIMLLVVIVGAFVLQIIGPVCVKLGAKKAGEVGLNITEEDLIKSYKVTDVMVSDVPVITAGMSISEIINLMSTTNSYYYSVVDNEKHLIGSITLDGIRNTFASQELNDWLVALDIMEPVFGKIDSGLSLTDGMEIMDRLHIEYAPVIAADSRLAGILDSRGVRRMLSAEVLERQRRADGMYMHSEA
jgi:Kef-type K+ transport system membrane component KefB/CBS domain-containing protein